MRISSSPSRRTAAVLALFTAAVAVALAVAQPATATPSPAASGSSGHRSARVCSTATAGAAACMSVVRTDLSPAAIGPAATPAGYGPSSLQSAYNLTGAGSGSPTVAIVDAFDDPTAEADLGVYRSQFGLPACTTANGCFRKVDQNGRTRYPRVDAGWALEISLDLDMVSAICPNCHILLVEAKTNSFTNLGTAENRAATIGAAAISNSWGGSDASDATNGAPFNHPGIAITVSSGDAGFGVQYPASSHFVTAVGGTTLTAGGGTRGWTETAWSGAGSGCSALNAALSGAASFGTGCATRAEADVSAVADPNTGVAVFDSTAFQGRSGWFVVGGTSASSPIIASVYALAGNSASIDNNFPYAHSSAFFDVTSGSNGVCSPAQLCQARAGWEGPTGLGTPNGTGGF
jgi:subtilase family serine protease